MSAMPALNRAATRYLTISFDDGFRASSVKTADLFESFGLRAEFNVVTTYGESKPEVFGGWTLWNELAARGHSIQPHGFDHTNKAKVGFGEARDLILRCLDSFSTNLHGFDPARAIFAFPYLASTPELEAWLPTIVRACRTAGEPINPLPTPDTVKLTTGASERAEELLDGCVGDLLARDEGWLIYCAHGLDGEGWGPMRSEYLERLLERLVQVENLGVLPARDVLDRFDGGGREAAPAEGRARG
jgi:peptidoglycan/xylan/chitin deacetylase (PgdA/CDA1 family)